MDGRDAKALQGRPGPQWDVSQTAFNSAGALRDLIRAVSYDDVQPQALLAAEALGLGLLVSPIRINEAIVALDGEDSVRWDRFRILLGLQANGTVKSIRNSTALTQFFLVATACKLCYTDVELGDIFFDIISESGVLNLFPVASSQLAKLVATFSGHCDRILPIDLMHDVAVLVDACSGNYAFYQRMENATLAKLICKIFEDLRNDSVEYISLSGCLSGLWLATFFSWLLPDQTSILVEDKVIKGSDLGRLSINLTKDDVEPTNFETRAWRLQTWRREGSPTTFVLDSKDQLQNEKMPELPIKQTKSYFHHQYAIPVIDRDGTGRREAIETIGHLAQALITHMTENGQVFVSKRCCSPNSRCSKTKLMNLQQEQWIGSYTDVIGNYGWDTESTIPASQTSALEAIKSVCLGTTLVVGPIVDKNALVKCLRSWVVERSRAWKDGSTTCQADRIVEAAILVANHAIASSLCDFQSGNLKMGFSGSSSSVSSAILLDSIILRNGLDVTQLRLEMLRCVFPHISPDNQNLAISIDGLVAGWGVLWEPTTRQRSVLRLRVSRGIIQRQKFRYERITEPYTEGSGSASLCHTNDPLYLFHSNSYVGLSSDREKLHISTNSVCSVVGNSLEIKTVMLCQDESGKENRRSVSWISALSALAGATHIERPMAMSRMQEEAIARILHNKPLEAYWASACHNNIGGMEEERNIMLRTAGDEELRFWAAGVLAQRSGMSHKCLSLVVRHAGSLMSSLNIAAKKNDYWALIC